MTQREQLEQLIDEGNGYLSCREAMNRGISPQAVSLYAHEMGLTREARGLYRDPASWEDPLHVFQFRYPKLIFSHETALFLLGLSEREPATVTATLATGTGSAALTHDGVKVYKVRPDLLELGLCVAETPFGHLVRCYDRERTLVDLLRSRTTVDQQELLSALKGYARSRQRDIPLLMRYARAFSVERLLATYLEVLL
ncbi:MULTISPECIES: type IV toxin-antitoxin system AbiEi family antitoxin domain-containing protein [Enorma]|uniref:type IV toxin-antitoxin system AbiEi family antitoxin domain-containing protein n=1 Tax=Enorma TaxID=1472762 RepID=UPI0003496B86|nr:MULTISPECIES: type IV toxin-antitoxin system AbiEi family antitoxin domain-containing protein [Enorma]